MDAVSPTVAATLDADSVRASLSAVAVLLPATAWARRGFRLVRLLAHVADKVEAGLGAPKQLPLEMEVPR